MANEEETIMIERRLVEMGLVLKDHVDLNESILGKKLTIQPVRIGMPGTPEEGQVFGPPKKDTPYPIDHIRIIKEKDGQMFVSMFSSKAGNKPITYRSLSIGGIDAAREGFEPIPRERALVPYERNLPVEYQRNLPIVQDRNLSEARRRNLPAVTEVPAGGGRGRGGGAAGGYNLSVQVYPVGAGITVPESGRAYVYPVG